MRLNQPAKPFGFTLIELVVTLLIIVVLAVTIVPKFTGKSSFDTFAYRDKMLSSLRLMQLRAMQNTLSTFCHQIIINSDGSTTQPGFGAAKNSTNCNSPEFIDDWQFKNSGFAIPNDSIVTINNNVAKVLTFDSFGRVKECTSSGCIIPIVGDDVVNICIATQGYISDC